MLMLNLTQNQRPPATTNHSFMQIPLSPVKIDVFPIIHESRDADPAFLVKQASEHEKCKWDQQNNGN